MEKIGLSRIDFSAKSSKFTLNDLVDNIVNKITEHFNISVDVKSLDKYTTFAELRAALTDQFPKVTENHIIEYADRQIAFSQNIIRLLEDGNLVLFAADYAGCPARFALSFPGRRSPEAGEWRRAWALAGGRGRTLADAVSGALGEAAECMSVWSRHQDDPLIVRDPDPAAGVVHRDPNRFLQLSRRQLHRLRLDQPRLSGLCLGKKVQDGDHINRFVQFQEKIEGRRHFVPALAALVGEEPNYGIDGTRLVTTSGTAVDADLEYAFDKAMFELIERDSVAIWWYQREPRPRLPHRLLEAAGGDDLRRWLLDRERKFHLLDLMTDTGVPVVAALSYLPRGGMIADGYAAGRTWPEAAFAAVLEMLQAEMSLCFMAEKAGRGGEDAESAFFAETRARNLLDARFMVGRDRGRDTGDADLDRETSASRTAERLHDLGIDLLVADITRPELGVPAARAVSAALRDWQPRFAPGRLYDVPVRMGWRDIPLAEDDLNPWPFLT